VSDKPSDERTIAAWRRLRGVLMDAAMKGDGGRGAALTALDGVCAFIREVDGHGEQLAVT